MLKRWFVWIGSLGALLAGCDVGNQSIMLDESIPRIETPAGQIALVRLKSYDRKLIQTALFDRQGRLLEEYNFGFSNSRVRNQYKGPLKVYSVVHHHSDSSGPGYSDSTRYQYEYDQQGRLLAEKQVGTGWSTGSAHFRYSYTPDGDTIKTRLDKPKLTTQMSASIPSVDRWERNRQGQLVRHYAFYAVQSAKQSRPDTLWHFSQRYTYDTEGKRKLAWYDYMYLGQFYYPAGPDTIQYQYDSQALLVGEMHRYTTDMRAKKEISLTGLNSSQRQAAEQNRTRFLKGDAPGLPSNNQTHRVRYTDEPFNPSRHLPLQIPR